MFAKTVCTPGSFLTLVPSGLRVELQYSSTGVLQNVNVLYQDDTCVRNSELLEKIISSRLAPSSIPLKGGTTWVYGVLHTSKNIRKEGVLPDCIYNDLIPDILKHSSDYTFYAGHVVSLAASFNSVRVSRNWMNMSGFSSLPGWVLPIDVDEDAFLKFMSNSCNFELPMISGYYLSSSSGTIYHPCKLRQLVVKEVNRYNDIDGHIKASVTCESETLTLPYSTVVQRNIASNTVLILDHSKIIYSWGNKSDKDISDCNLTCTVCGKKFRCPDTGEVTCDDPHCRSLMYPAIKRFLTALSLPMMTEARFLEVIHKKLMVDISDIFLLDEYKDLKISITLDKLIQATVPVEVCPNSSYISVLVSKCSNSWSTLKYYLENPLRMSTDIGINTVIGKRLVDWLSEPYNILTLETFINSEQLSILDTIKKFEGAPIFRDKKIAITGKFAHGDAREVISILSSYSAKVVLQFEPDVDCLIIGDIKEGIDGSMIRSARDCGLSIFEEKSFFDAYGIDSDMLQYNLL